MATDDQVPASPGDSGIGPDDLSPIVLPAYPLGPLTPRDILLGRPLDPPRVIGTYSDEEYEVFVKEWAQDGLAARYAVVRRASGSGDMGRDVLGFVTPDLASSPYDNFQCKHYRGALAPSDVWIEIGKVCWYTFRGDYRVPRAYYFVAPRGVGPTLQRYLEDPDRLRREFIANWEGHCATSITRGTTIGLDGDFRRYVDAFDFRIFKAVDPDELVAQHATTRWHAARFGGGLRPRPPAEMPPETLQTHETRYVRQLLDAYADYLGIDVSTVDALSGHRSLIRHFTRQREMFYQAASLRQFERDTMPHDEGFLGLMEDIYDGVVDICEGDHANGYVRLGEVIRTAVLLNPSSYALVEYLHTADKAGICHHLANDDRLSWCPNDHA